MAFQSELPKDEKGAADFRSLSDADFARLSTEDKFGHIRLGMRELARTLVELAAARAIATQERLRLRAKQPSGRAHGDE